MTERVKITGIRNGTTHPAEIDDVKVYITINRNELNKICEIYVTTSREGTCITGLLNSLSKTISAMLQYNAPAEDISRMLRGQKYEPYGFVRKHPFIKSCSSISDLISKVIDIELGDYSRCQVKPDNYEKLSLSGATSFDMVTNAEGKVTSFQVVATKEPIGEKLYGLTCPTCSSTKMRQNGSCHVCEECGTTTGCS